MKLTTGITIFIGIAVFWLTVNFVSLVLASDPNDITITPNPDGTLKVVITVSKLQKKALLYNGVDEKRFKEMIGRMLDNQVATAKRKYANTLTDKQIEQAMEQE